MSVASSSASPSGGAGDRCRRTGRAPIALAQRPGVAQAAEGSAFSVTLDTGDPVEQAALKAAGFFRSAVGVAGGYDPDAHRWLHRLYGDKFTHGTASFAAILFTLVQAALGFPTGCHATSHDHLTASSTRPTAPEGTGHGRSRRCNLTDYP